MTSRITSTSLKHLISALLMATLAAPLHADTWPQDAVGAEAAGFTAEGIAQLDAAMREIVANQDVAGMVWMLGKDGQIATFEAAGLARVNDQAPMTQDSLFRIYSMSKPVTGVAMMMLWEQGLWDFDDPISKFVPEFANLKVLSNNNTELVDLTRQPTCVN
jgi:CubicO group peptidase (beta-lactamase class C family)